MPDPYSGPIRSIEDAIKQSHLDTFYRDRILPPAQEREPALTEGSSLEVLRYGKALKVIDTPNGRTLLQADLAASRGDTWTFLRLNLENRETTVLALEALRSTGLLSQRAEVLRFVEIGSMGADVSDYARTVWRHDQTCKIVSAFAARNAFRVKNSYLTIVGSVFDTFIFLE